MGDEPRVCMPSSDRSEAKRRNMACRRPSARRRGLVAFVKRQQLKVDASCKGKPTPDFVEAQELAA